MRTLATILLTASMLAYVPAFVAHAEDTAQDDLFSDSGEGMPEMPDITDSSGIPLEEGAAPADEPAQADAGQEAPAAPQSAASDDAFAEQEEAAPEAPAAPAAEVAPAPAPKKQKAKAQKTAKAEKKSAKKTAKAEKKAGKKERKTASVGGGFMTTRGDCTMHAKASESSKVLTTVKGSKKIWTEKHNGGWVKVFRTNGHGFISSDCF